MFYLDLCVCKQINKMKFGSKTPNHHLRGFPKGLYHRKIKNDFTLSQIISSKTNKFHLDIKKLNYDEHKNENSSSVNKLFGSRSLQGIKLHKKDKNSTLPYITAKDFSNKTISPCRRINEITSSKNNNLNTSKTLINSISGSTSPNTKRTLYLLNKKNLFNYQGIVSNPSRLFYSSCYFNRNNKNNTTISHPQEVFSQRTHSSQNNLNENYIRNKKNNYELKCFHPLSVQGHSRGILKTNQDDYLTLDSTPYSLKLFGVFDGHGENGHLVSSFLKNYFTELFLNSKISLQFTNNFTPGALYQYFTNRQNDFLISLFTSCEKKLSTISYINSDYSGSTCNLVFLIEDYLICANVGDSRAIMITNDNKIIQLSRDHKPEVKDEYERIMASNGRVERAPANASIGPFRVWLRNENLPGLAMSRSIGDFVAEKVGVICEPEITVYKLSETNCKSIILASDGVWEFTSNERVKSIVWDYYNSNNPEGAANAIKDYASKMWSANGDMADDITVIVLFFGQ